MIDKKYVGKIFEPFCFTVEKNKICEFAQSIGSENSVYYNRKVALSKGFLNIPAPLTFGVAINTWGNPELPQKLKEIGINMNELVPVEQKFEYFSPIYAGDEITAFLKIETIRSSKVMDFVTVSIHYKLQKELVLISSLSVVSMNRS